VAAAEGSAVNPQTFISKLNSVVKLYHIQKNEYGVTGGCYAIVMEILQEQSSVNTLKNLRAHHVAGLATSYFNDNFAAIFKMHHATLVII
jgi:hypothetical protein